MSNVSGIVKSIRDIMRKDKGTYGDVQRLEQLGWMFFLKIFDDREQEMELLNDNYQSPIAKDLRWRNWATDEEGITGDNLLNFVDNDLLPSLKELKNTGNPIISLIKSAFEDATNYMKNGTLLRQVINKVNEIDFNSSDDRHLFGDIYEKLLSELQAAKDAGEFYTPRAVTEFIVERVNPELHEKILDPACGTGGFLVNVIEHLRKKVITENDQNMPIILSNVVSSQVDVHKEFGGVVPELAARSHIEKIDWITEKAIKDSNIKLENIDAIASTAGPGVATINKMKVSSAR